MKFIPLTILFSVFISANIDTAIKDSIDTNKKSASIQATIDTYASESEALYEQYKQLERELEEQRSYNRQLELVVFTQKSELPKLQTQLEAIEVTQKKIVPLMFDMLSALEKFVNLDTPFLQEERLSRVANLKSYLSNPEISLSEQFRMILEAYKIEYSYARTIEAYRATLDDATTVDFLRLGRVALFYQTLDEQESGIYDLGSKSWIKLDPHFNAAIAKALKMARKKTAPDFLLLPLPTSKGTL